MIRVLRLITGATLCDWISRTHPFFNFGFPTHDLEWFESAVPLLVLVGPVTLHLSLKFRFIFNKDFIVNTLNKPGKSR